MFEASLFKCVDCNEFYKKHSFCKIDIDDMKNKNKLLYCKNCVKIKDDLKKNYYIVKIIYFFISKDYSVFQEVLQSRQIYKYFILSIS